MPSTGQPERQTAAAAAGQPGEESGSVDVERDELSVAAECLGSYKVFLSVTHPVQQNQY